MGVVVGRGRGREGRVQDLERVPNLSPDRYTNIVGGLTFEESVDPRGSWDLGHGRVF